MHRLDENLLLENLYNFSFQGLSNGDQGVNIAVNSSATITWNASLNIEISSIRFTLHNNFTSILRFKHSQFVPFPFMEMDTVAVVQLLVKGLHLTSRIPRS